MRTFKFRVWDFLNKRILNYDQIMCLPMWDVFPGTPEQRMYTVMQYTGFKDMSNKEIYEGDTVKINYTKMDNTKKNITGVVYFNKGQWLIKSEIGDILLHCEKGTIYFNYINWEIEVIGNIYENQENNN